MPAACTPRAKREIVKIVNDMLLDHEMPLYDTQQIERQRHAIYRQNAEFFRRYVTDALSLHVAEIWVVELLEKIESM